MDDARTTPIVSPAEAEDFFATGHNAFTGESDLTSGSPITIDVPAVGATPANQLPSLGGVAVPEETFADTVRAFVDQGARILARDRALSELIFAARDMAEASILTADFEGQSAWCRECQASQFQGFRITHMTFCKTGRVLKALEDLRAAGGDACEHIAQKGGAQ